MTKQVHHYYRYSNCFKEKVVQEVSQGESLSSVSRKYGIKGSNTVRKWLLKYGRLELLSELTYVKMRTEEDKLKQLELENKRLKIALADATLAKDVLESLIDIVDEHYQTDVKKNLGHQLLHDVPKKRNNR